jgi:hypothetical protein
MDRLNFNQIHELAIIQMLHYTVISMDSTKVDSVARTPIMRRTYHQMRTQVTIEVNCRIRELIDNG